MNIKVLPLQGWQKRWHRVEKFEGSHYEEVKPVFKRPGQYCLGGAYWFEIEDGRAYKLDGKSFESDLAILEYKEQRPEVLRAIKTLSKCRSFASEKQQRLILAYHIVRLTETGPARKSKAKRKYQIRRLKCN